MPAKDKNVMKKYFGETASSLSSSDNPKMKALASAEIDKKKMNPYKLSIGFMTRSSEK